MIRSVDLWPFCLWKHILSDEMQAFQYVSDRRCCVHPNLGFMHQLSEFEHIKNMYFAQCHIQSVTRNAVQILGQPVLEQNLRKRQLEDDIMLDDEDMAMEDGMQEEEL